MKCSSTQCKLIPPGARLLPHGAPPPPVSHRLQTFPLKHDFVSLEGLESYIKFGFKVSNTLFKGKPKWNENKKKCLAEESYIYFICFELGVIACVIVFTLLKLSPEAGASSLKHNFENYQLTISIYSYDNFWYERLKCYDMYY